MASRRSPRKETNRDIVARDVVERELPKKQNDVFSSARSDGPEEKLTGHMLRLKRSWWRGLERHFKLQGLSVAAGIRQVLSRYMRDNKIEPILPEEEE